MGSFVLDNELPKVTQTRHCLSVISSPQIIRKRIFEELHCQTYSGHLGRD